MSTLSFPHFSHSPDRRLEPGLYLAKVQDAGVAQDVLTGEEFIHISWDVNGFLLTETLRVSSPDPQIRDFAQWKLSQILAALGLPQPEEKEEGEKINYPLSLLAGNFCRIEVEHFINESGKLRPLLKRCFAATSEAPGQPTADSPGNSA